jgi:hypothetical protein
VTANNRKVVMLILQLASLLAGEYRAYTIPGGISRRSLIGRGLPGLTRPNIYSPEYLSKRPM